MEIEITQRKEEIFVGQPIEVDIQIRNQSTEDLSVTVKLGSQLIEYTGEILRNLRSNDEDTRKIKIAKGAGIYFINVLSYNVLKLTFRCPPISIHTIFLKISLKGFFTLF